MKKLLSSFILAAFVFTHIFASMPAFCEEPLHGHAEVTDSRKLKDEKMFTGEIDELKSRDVIKMTVSQVLSSGFTEEGDEFFAEISSEVEGEKGVILPTGTIAHGCVREISDSKRLGRDGWIEVSFDYLITPDGREIPIKGEMSTKMNPVAATARNVAIGTGYTAVGGLVGGLLALNMFGLPAAVRGVPAGHCLVGPQPVWAAGTTRTVRQGVPLPGMDPPHHRIDPITNPITPLEPQCIPVQLRARPHCSATP